jgi:hypothetical protein
MRQTQSNFGPKDFSSCTHDCDDIQLKLTLEQSRAGTQMHTAPTQKPPPISSLTAFAAILFLCASGRSALCSFTAISLLIILSKSST